MLLRIPDDCFLTAGTHRDRLFSTDVQHGAVTVTDPDAHPGVDEEQQPVTLEHFTGHADLAVREDHFGRLVALHDVRNAKRGRLGDEIIALIIPGTAIDPRVSARAALSQARLVSILDTSS